MPQRQNARAVWICGVDDDARLSDLASLAEAGDNMRRLRSIARVLIGRAARKDAPQRPTVGGLQRAT
jgi:hypothetical protein